VLHGGGERGFARTAELGLGFNPLSDKHGGHTSLGEGQWMPRAAKDRVSSEEISR
jgi:hypothetical protein